MVEFHHHHGLCGLRAAEREFVKLRAQPTAKAKAIYGMEEPKVTTSCDTSYRHHIDPPSFISIWSHCVGPVGHIVAL